jgi:hypothetical protein
LKTCNESRATWKQLAVLLLCLSLALGGCGGSDSRPVAGEQQGMSSATMLAPPAPTTDPPANALPVTVRPGPGNRINVPFTSVTICTPGSVLQCQTIDDVIVDTGSTGLRLFASAISPALALPGQADAASGAALAECMQFVDGSIWGAIKLADVRLAGEQANSMAIQVVADPVLPSVPTDCANTGRISETVQDFGGNGILGVGVFLQDCGPRCEQEAQNGVYYHCGATGCAPGAVALAQQVPQPVAFFPINNNGVMLSMPDLPADSAATANGELVFGIGTQANNGLGVATVLALDANGLFTTIYKGRNFTQSFIDSGSNGIFFFDPDIPACPAAFYCATTPLALTATNVGLNGASSAVSFVVANARTAVSDEPDHWAFETLAGPIGSTKVFDWGMPFFYGRKVFTAIEGRATPAGVGPLYAYLGTAQK